mgnify:CR=1 FL=1
MHPQERGNPHSVHPVLLPNFIPSSSQCHPILFPNIIPSFPTSSHPISQLHPILLCTFTLTKSKGKEALGNTLMLHSPKE